ncbi:hypothetical protein BDB00DRAFT_771480 [Zychaea mexicana]|uniref:uncharacterized protein n=1 Tax=Zychaea mexicana TaxID=64656 RepID=UPI0022FE7984|nr:uncharacterized protein BDB00DRAFT_771480 [Zychaea mexicana]KAI9489004.1 hypothetical protein BDB00DRAFT_771480 [Zychaea mexicana]
MTPIRFVPGNKIPNRRKWVIRRIVSVAIVMVIEIGLPLALYYGLRNIIGVVYSLVLSGAPPFLYVLYEFIRRRRIDILGCIIGLSFIISGALSISSGDARAEIIRDSAVSAVIGGMFLISLIPVRTRWFTTRPLAFVIARQILYPGIKYRWTDRYGNLQEQDMVLWRWEHVKVFRFNMYGQTIGWGFLLITTFVACVLLVEVSDLSDDDVIMYNYIITGATTGLMVIVPLAVWVYEHKRATQIGKQWTKENDFTGKIQRQTIEKEDERSIVGD